MLAWRNWIARRPPEPKVAASSPVASAIPNEWTRATDRQPERGQYVEIGRLLGGELVALDCLWWYPDSWTLPGMYWRPKP
jgi:hypothetical protein